MMKKNFLLSLFGVILIWGLIKASLTVSCNAPYIIFDQVGANRPNTIVERLVAQHDGLPKAGFDLIDGVFQLQL